MQRLKKLIVVIGILVTWCASGVQAETPAAGSLTLAEKGVARYQIALAADATAPEITAAQVLKRTLLEVTGAHFSVLNEGEVAANAPQILVGAGKRVRQLLPQQDWKALGSDGIVVKTVSNSLILAGGRPRGSLYAVFQFLEDGAGCRWWTSTEKTIPYRETLTVAPQNVVYKPQFDYREHLTTPIVIDPVFAVTMRENGHFTTPNAEWGGHYNILGFCHTMTRLLPPETYFKSHPEWYSDPLNGGLPCTAKSKMPSPHDTQLCMSSESSIKELTKNALKWIEENPAAGYISISETDVATYCHCPQCEALFKAEGSQSGPILKYVNAVAAGIHKRYPNFKVETLAYHDSEKPPKTIRPAKNVIVRLAPISADYGQPLNSEANKAVRDNVENWSKVAPELFIWNYVTNFHYSIMPHPNWKGLSDDLRFFAAHNVTGIFEQGDSYTNGVGDFVQLRSWITAKMMWDPSLDQDELTNTFLQGYYGAAAPYLKQYIDVLQKGFLDQKRPLSTFNSDFSYLTLDVMTESTKLFAAAAAAVKNDPVLTARVRRERLSLDLCWIYRYYMLKRTAAAEKKEFLGPADLSAGIEEFIATAKSFGVLEVGENRPFSVEIPVYRSLVRPVAPLPGFIRDRAEHDVIDFQQDDFTLYGKGSSTDIEPDAAASDGKTAYIMGSADGWLAQAPFNKVLEATPERWHVYAMVRVQVKEGAVVQGNGFVAGIHHGGKNIALTASHYPLAAFAGKEYKQLDLGVHELNSEAYCWFSSSGSKDVEKVYIDRVLLVREP